MAESTIIDAIQKLWKKEQTNWSLVSLKPPPSFTPEPTALPVDTVIKPRTAYVRITMRSVSIEATRVGWNKFHAALYSHCVLPLRNGKNAEIQTVLSPQEFKDLEKGNLDRVIFRDRTAFGPVPYIGGSLRMALGVVAVKQEDLSGPFLDVLTTLSGAAGVAYMAAVTPFIGPIKKGVELLTGSGAATSLEIGFETEYLPPKTGWYVLVRRVAGSLPKDKLSISDDIELQVDGKTLRGVTTLIFSVDATTSRDDWAQIPELQKIYEDFVAAAGDNKKPEAEEIAKTFRRHAQLCPELLSTHALEVARSVDEELARVFPGGPVVAGTPIPRMFAQLPVVLKPQSD